MSLFDITPQAVNRNYGKETRAALEAQIGLMPQLFQANAQWQPLYQALELQNMEQFLLGSPEQTYTTYAWQDPVYRERSGRVSGGTLRDVQNYNPLNPAGYFGPLGPNADKASGITKYIPTPLDTIDPVSGISKIVGLFGGDDKPKRRLLRKGGYVPTGTATRGKQRGFLSLYNDDILPSMMRAQTAQRESEINDVLNLGPKAREALRASSPDAARLLDLLNADATKGMEMGAQLDPSLRREVQQSVRAGQAARGMGVGPSDLFEEALQTGSAAEALRASRRAAAANAIGLDQQFYGDTFQQILARPGNAGAQMLGGQAQAAGPLRNLFNPESAYANAVNDFNANARQSANNIGASNNAAMLSGLMNMFGNMAGGAMGAMV
jgi:hypothetical protein